MGAKKKQMPAFNPPRPLAPIGDWIEHRRELDRLEAELRESHPDLAWSDELQSLKVEADAAIKALTPQASAKHQHPVAPAAPDPVQEPTDVKYYPSDEPVRMGLEQFNRGNFGLSQRYFKDAVEKAPMDLTAWIGLASSYDRLRRFDLADQAYLQTIGLGA